MQVSVWDTYVVKRDGSTMHFDIIVPTAMTNTETIYGYGQTYLASKGQAGQPLTSNECRFCHVETVRPEWELAIQERGYYVYEMENCDG
ncbi:MAG TPA: DUF2024 family protein [Parapedobacter sp.]|uniref:DUF2024 family protein n=1 Tax=Parapedobacter sp. TaxID=1958893 RepID=UPI002CC26148|nr:DUF2024 family protein [Parapedobacter sp.]HWK59594.1 DUF2024 family protein [Parapedobacter sp.]